MQRIAIAASVLLVLAPAVRADDSDPDDLQKVLREIAELRKTAEKEVQARTAETKAAQKALEDMRLELLKAQQQAKELQSHADETKAAKKALEDVRLELLKAQQQTEELKYRLATAEIELQLYKKNMATLEKLVARLEKNEPRQVEELPQPAAEKPTADVRGKITSMAQTDLYVVSIGADDGLNEGQVLQVFRAGETPKHFGTLTLIRTYGKQSIGQLKANGRERPQIGDEVGTRVFTK